MQTKDNGQMKNNMFSNNVFALSWIFRISPGYVIYFIVWEVLGDVCVLAEHTYFLAYVIRCIENKSSFENILLFFIPITLFIFLRMFVYPWFDAYISPKIVEKINREIKFALFQKVSNIAISSYDNPEFYNEFIWSMQEVPAHLMGTLETVTALLSTITRALIVGAYMVSTNILGLVFVLFTTIVTFLGRFAMTKNQVKYNEEIIPFRRKQEYVNRVFYLSQYAKDLRLSDIKKRLFVEYKESTETIKEVVKKYATKILLWDYIINTIRNVIVFDGVYLTYLLYHTLVTYNLGYGQLLALYNSSRNLRDSLDELLSSMPKFKEHSMYIDKFRTFLSVENYMVDQGKLKVPIKGDIEIKHLCFSYPNSNVSALQDICMTIKQGEKIALVGYNGAGKSTLAKLIMRLYEPSSGMITFSNNSITEYPLSEYRKLFATLFQDFEIFAATLGENIVMSRDAVDKQKAREIFKKTGFEEKFEALSDGFRTPLTKEFEERGINLSGGEAQKVALSRVLYSDANILIFDEPSSALDPIAEYQLNQTILEIANEKTVIIITHRLSTTRFVDKIYMLDSGAIIEKGTHEQLMAMRGRYAAMYNMQKEKYR